MIGRKPMKSISLITIFYLFCLTAFGQGTLRGKITDESGETLIGVTIVLKANRSVGTITDFDGNYSLKIAVANPQTIIISYISYAEIEETVTLKNGEVLVKNFVMKSASKAIGEVQITAKAVKSKEYFVEAIKRNSAVTLDFISSETMKKTGDANVTAAIARVSGVSTNSGFITVRGVGDRYIKTAVNGSVIPTLDPFTNNIKLDLFPASLVDNILITKTASADIPGDWSGAFLSVETKDYPDELNINFETSFGYNNQSTFKDVITSKKSESEWLGYDNNLRDFDHNKYVAAVPTPSIYQEMVALGLGSYYASIGVSGDNWGEGQQSGDTYFKLGLVQLGLLAPALIDNASAFQTAKSAYLNGNYKAEAFRILNAGVPGSGKAMSDNWNSTRSQGPVNFSNSFSIGNQIKLFGRDLGFIAGYRYGSSVQYDPTSESFRLRLDQDQNGNLSTVIASSGLQDVSREVNGWSALFNVAYKFSPNHSIGLLFMPNFNGTNNVRDLVDENDPNNFVWTKSQFYEQRKQLVYQFKSEHYLPKTKIKIESHASYTRGKSIAPDFRNLQYFEDPINKSFQIGGTIGDGIHRFYRYLTDNVLDSRFTAEMPISKVPGMTRKIKAGISYLKGEKNYNQYDYSLNFGRYAPVLLNDDLNSFFALSNFDITSGVDQNIPYSTIYQYYTENGNAANNTFGETETKSFFLMGDYAINPIIRISGGIRLEQANIYTDVVKFDSLGYAKDDIRRTYSASLPLANPGKIDELSILPSLNVIYKLRDEELTPVNLRINYSQTVARPSVRELSDIAVFDFEFRTAVFGNSNLKIVNIDNYDLRLESYFKNGDDASISLYYKNFRNHIELINSGGVTWQNVDKSRIYGIELEGKKVITKNLDFRANLTLSKSETEYIRTRFEIDGGVKNYIPLDTVKRDMFGQAPYVLNAMMTYTSDSSGFTATVSYNVQGPRLVIVSDLKELPNIYEMPRHIVDIKLSKRLGRHFNVSLTIRDLFNSPVRRSYKENNYAIDFDNYRWGTNYLLGLSYKL
jgi:outer membrane receptor protein involved in Fe transport